MLISEKNALGRVLMISKRVYSAAGNGESTGNLILLLDTLSAMLSHINSPDQPMAKLMKKLQRDVKKAASKELFIELKQYFAKLVPVQDYDFERALPHIPAIIHGNDKICEKMVRGQPDRARTMCSAMESYPGYLFGEYEALSDSQFYDLVFGYYPKLYDDEFMGSMKKLFKPDDTEDKTDDRERKE